MPSKLQRIENGKQKDDPPSPPVYSLGFWDVEKRAERIAAYRAQGDDERAAQLKARADEEEDLKRDPGYLDAVAEDRLAAQEAGWDRQEREAEEDSRRNESVFDREEARWTIRHEEAAIEEEKASAVEQAARERGLTIRRDDQGTVVIARGREEVRIERHPDEEGIQVVEYRRVSKGDGWAMSHEDAAKLVESAMTLTHLGKSVVDLTRDEVRQRIGGDTGSPLVNRAIAYQLKGFSRESGMQFARRDEAILDRVAEVAKGRRQDAGHGREEPQRGNGARTAGGVVSAIQDAAERLRSMASQVATRILAARAQGAERGRDR